MDCHYDIPASVLTLCSRRFFLHVLPRHGRIHLHLVVPESCKDFVSSGVMRHSIIEAKRPGGGIRGKKPMGRFFPVMMQWKNIRRRTDMLCITDGIVLLETVGKRLILCFLQYVAPSNHRQLKTSENFTNSYLHHMIAAYPNWWPSTIWVAHMCDG